YPEDELPAIVDLMAVTNDEPLGDLEVEAFRFTADQLRQQEAYMTARGDTRWTLYVRETATGVLAGFTEVMWHPERPALLNQGHTAVWPEYRGRGLGRWLKAAMLDKVLCERPTVRYVRTGNADSNVPMLKINHELGFRPYQADSMWQVPVTTVQAYLASRESAGVSGP
ncbi:MAG TPA: hypothetical protein VM536_08985, partial [Chloroflexia bacterium]|nr:hypothetical protein [Chloroflexia bacterium]